LDNGRRGGEDTPDGLDVRRQHPGDGLLESSLFSKFQNRSVLVSTDLPLRGDVLLESVGHFDLRFHSSLPWIGSGVEIRVSQWGIIAVLLTAIGAVARHLAEATLAC